MLDLPLLPASFSSLHIVVLKGGLSAERDVSLVSGAACAAGLRQCGARVTEVDACRDLAIVLAELKPDAVFNALHGAWGEDGCVQGILETLQIPYSHSGVLASALAMDKDKAKAVLRQHGVNVPGGGLFDRRVAGASHVMPPPYVVKPNAEGSSVGIFMVNAGANRPPAELLSADWAFGESVLIEPFIPGRELTVAVLDTPSGPQAMAVTDIIAATRFYDYEAKYQAGGSRHIVPAELKPEVTAEAMRMAERAHVALGCTGLSRTDLRFDEGGLGLVALEVNTQPGMTPTSLAPEQAAYVGITFDRLVGWLIEDALRRAATPIQAAA